MADEIVGLKIQVDTNAGEAVGSLRSQLKAAQAEVAALSDKFGATSKEAIEAAKRAAELKDKIGDAKALTDAFNPDAKFKALSASLSGVAGGFAAVQGAMGLFGSESKELEKQLLKVQSAMALSQGLQSIGESVDSFKQLGAVIKSQVVTAFTTLRGAIMATGIGLLTSAIAYLIENFESVKKTIYELFPALKGLFDNMDRITQIAKGVGKAIVEFIAAPISAIVKAIQGDFSGAMEALKNGISFTKNYRIGEANEIKKQAEEKEKARQEELKKEKEKHDKLLAEQRRHYAEMEAERNRMEKEKGERLNQENNTNFKNYQESLKALRDFQAKDKETKDAQTLKDSEDKKQKAIEDADEQLRVSQAVADGEIAIEQSKMQVVEGSLSVLSMIFQKNKDVQKGLLVAESALGIAKIIISTQEANAKAIAVYGAINPPLAASMILLNKVNAGIGIAANIAATSKALSVLGSGGGGVNGAGGSAQGGGYSFSSGGSAPISPTANVTTTQLNQSSINQLRNNTVKAYVVESDISDSQYRQRRIIDAATFD